MRLDHQLTTETLFVAHSQAALLGTRCPEGPYVWAVVTQSQGDIVTVGGEWRTFRIYFASVALLVMWVGGCRLAV